jgi:hypothetical protein
MVGARYGFPCTHLVPGKNKLQTVSLPTLDPPRYNSRFTANGHLHLYPNVGGSKRVQQLSPLRPTPRQIVGYRPIKGEPVV